MNYFGKKALQSESPSTNPTKEYYCGICKNKNEKSRHGFFLDLYSYKTHMYTRHEKSVPTGSSHYLDGTKIVEIKDGVMTQPNSNDA